MRRNATEPDDDEIATLIRSMLRSHDDDVPADVSLSIPEVRVRSRRARSNRLVKPFIAGAVVIVVIVSAFTSRPSREPEGLAVGNETSATAPTAERGPEATTPGVASDGTMRFGGLVVDVPESWVHASYLTPCNGEPDSDYAIILTQPPAAVTKCLVMHDPPLSGILVMPVSAATGWIEMTAAVQRDDINGVTVMIGRDARERTVVVLPQRGWALRIEADQATTSSILASLRGG